MGWLTNISRSRTVGDVTPKATTRAAIYCRISRDPGHDELGVKRQQADCAALCDRFGWSVAEVFVDDDRSVYSGKRRPQYERMMQAVKDRMVTAIVAWHPDRLTRHPRELEDLIDLLEATRAKIATVQSGEYDLATASGRMTARVVGAVARHESEHKSARLRRKHLELAEAGKLSGGGGQRDAIHRPFGYDVDRVHVVVHEAKIIRDLARRVLAGETLRGVTADLNRRGVPTVNGAPWSTVVVRRMLVAPRWAGLREHRDLAQPVKAVWPAIIEAESHRRLVALLTEPTRLLNRSPRRYMLTGIATCSLCGAKLVARPRGDKRRCYVCATGPNFHGCGKIRVLAEPLEAVIVEAVIRRLDTPELAATIQAGASSDEHDLLDRAADIDTRLAELGEMWAAGEIDRAGWTAARRRLEADRDALGARVRADTGVRALQANLDHPGGLRAAWADLGFDRQRAIVEAVIEAVVIAPAVKGRNKFDPDRVDVTWRA
jgi:DNA invertase Pin-like site-specific DNA recombinase